MQKRTRKEDGPAAMVASSTWPTSAIALSTVTERTPVTIGGETYELRAAMELGLIEIRQFEDDLTQAIREQRTKGDGLTVDDEADLCARLDRAACVQLTPTRVAYHERDLVAFIERRAVR